jgi:hypothetical protein
MTVQPALGRDDGPRQVMIMVGRRLIMSPSVRLGGHHEAPGTAAGGVDTGAMDRGSMGVLVLAMRRTKVDRSRIAVVYIGRRYPRNAVTVQTKAPKST